MHGTSAPNVMSNDTIENNNDKVNTQKICDTFWQRVRETFDPPIVNKHRPPANYVPHAYSSGCMGKM